MADFWSHSTFASSYFKFLLVGPNLKILKQLFCLWFTSETFLFLLEEKEKEKQKVYRCKVDSCSCVSETDPPWECVEIIEDVRSLGAHLQVSFHWSSRSASQVAMLLHLILRLHFPSTGVLLSSHFMFQLVFSLRSLMSILLALDIIKAFVYKMFCIDCLIDHASCTFLVRKVGLYLLVLLLMDSAELDTFLKVISSS